MSIRLLFDENLAPLYKTQLLLKKADIIVYFVGEPGAPPKGTLDPEILCWCEDNEFVLFTNNRKSMPVHLAEHLRLGRHIPGIITGNADMSVGQTLEELMLIAEVGIPGDFTDRIEYLPL